MKHHEDAFSLIKLHELSERELISQIRERRASAGAADASPTLSYMEYALDILNSKWTLDVLFVIAHKKVFRYNQIRKEIPGISSLMLSRTLKNLERHHIVRRLQFNERPIRIEYHLDELGYKLRYALWALTLWGMDVYEATHHTLAFEDEMPPLTPTCQEEPTMARKMNHAERQLSTEQAQALLAKGKEGVLSVNGDNGYPYAVPVNYVYQDGAIYIHTSKVGYKVEAIQANPKVCFTAVLFSEIIEADTTTKFESVVATGDAVLLTDDAEKEKIMEAIVRSLAPSNIEGGMATIQRLLPAVGIIKINVAELTGKAYR